MDNMLSAGEWGGGWTCPICKFSNSGARLRCFQCGYAEPKKVDTPPECVEETAESANVSQPHRYAGSFGHD